MEFACNDMSRIAFGFANPNHAAALICAMMPFCWGWRRWRWFGFALFAALCVMLAATFSRTGFLVLALEAAAWWLMSRRDEVEADGLSDAQTQVCVWRFSHVAVWLVVAGIAAASVWWMWPRLTMDGAVTNRPLIWLAGARLFAANPLGVGFGDSGLIASAFLLPDGVAVRTLVNSHLTLLVESGLSAGALWLAFIASSLASGCALRRIWISFAGLTLSACVSSVFDWHVLFDFGDLGGKGILNFILSWIVFIAFVAFGAALAAKGAGKSHAFRRMAFSAFSVAFFLFGVCLVFVSDATPRVADGFVEFGGGGPVVLHDSEWALRELKGFFPDGAKVRVDSGADGVEPADDMWLFGNVAESSGRFPGARVAVVSPPEFYEPGENVKRILLRRFSETRDDQRVEYY